MTHACTTTTPPRAGSRLGRRRLLGALLAASVLATMPAALTTSAAAAPKSRIVLTGSSTVAPLLGDIARRYESLNPGIQVDVQSGGSSRGISDVRRGLADVGMISRALYENEDDLVPTTVAYDGLALIVHASNPVAALDDDTIRAIFTGAVTDWSEVPGGGSGAITLVNKADGRSTLELFLAHLDLDPARLKSHVVIGENEQGIKMVAGNRGAIGYVSIGAVEFATSIGVPLKALPLGPVAPTTENVARGLYGSVRPLVLVTAGAPQDATVVDFLAFATSEMVHDLVSEHYLVARAD